MFRALIVVLIIALPAISARADDPYYALETRYDEIGEIRVYDDPPTTSPAQPCAMCAGY